MTINLPDEALMLGVRDGDLPLLGILFERHSPALFDFFCRMTGSRVISEDLVQDVFVRILKYRSNYQAKGKFTTWMFHIARNARTDYFKVHKPYSIVPEAHIPEGPTAPAVERNHEAILLERALMKLPDDKREILVLARFREIKQEEIAEMLGIEIGTVKVRLHRAIKELREIYFKLSGENAPCNAKKSTTILRIV
jgi:RNA polymerase sigma-70 factor, ECF subfamily